MKKILFAITLLLISVVAIACQKEAKLEIETADINLSIGETHKITYTVTEGFTIDWTVSQEGIINLENGEIEAIGEGNVTITVKVNKTKIEKTIKVTVAKINATEVSISGDTTGEVGDTITLTASVTPLNATDKTLEWSSNNETVATVTGGVVSLLKVGTVKIMVTVKDTNITDEITITVTEKVVDVASVTIAGPTSGNVGYTLTLTATVSPENATNKQVTWSSSDESVAKVNASGVVSLLKRGTSTITAKAGGKEDSVTITVSEVLIGNLELTGKNAGKVGETITLTAVITPNDTTDKTVTWSSSDESVATVTNGTVSLLKAGTVTITATSGAKQATIQITVTASSSVAFIGETGYLSLEAALAAAKDGDTIALKSGTYEKAFTVSVPNLTFTSLAGETAILTGKITLEITNKVTFKNLSFTGNAQIYTGANIDGFVFTNNKVYDSTITPSDYFPNNRTDVNAFIQFFTMTGTNIVGDITITNNTFTNVRADVISLSRTTKDKQVIITNNEFRNFGVGAIRFDGGYNNGTYKILSNKFINDELGGYNAILFRAYSPENGNVQEIYIEDNIFKNIGVSTVGPADTYPGSAVIATSTFNDNMTKIYIRYNSFENCFNNIHLRNVTDKPENWHAFINYNEFRGATGYIYTESKGLADLKYNFYIDSDGNPITDDAVLKALITNNNNYQDFYNSEIDYTMDKVSPKYGEVTLYVDSALAGSTSGAAVKVNNKDFVFGTTAFATIKDAVAVAKVDDVIYVLAGTYSDSFTINTSNLTLLGVNKDVDPNNQNRATEAIITGNITLAKDLNNITINGFHFDGTAQIIGDGGANLDGFKFAYNLVTTSLSYYNVRIIGFMELISLDNNKTFKNIVLSNNSYNFTSTSAPRFLLGGNIENLYVANNVMNSSSGTFTDIIRITGTNLDNTAGSGLSGKLYVYSNEFNNAGQCAIFVTKYTNLDAKIIGNKFVGTITSVIRLRFTGDTEAKSKIIFNFNEVELNTIASEYPIAAIRIENAATGTLVTANYNNFPSIPFNYYFTIPAGAVVNAKYNYYGGNAPDAAKMDGVDDYSEHYTSLNDMPKYGSTIVILPTSISVVNPVATIVQFETYKLNVSVEPSNTTNAKVSYKSSDETIATVDANGNVFARKGGNVTITITSIADATVKTTVTFEVLAEERVEIDYEGPAAIEVGKTLQLIGKAYGSTNAVTWSTSDGNIATVSETGIVTAVSKGTVEITAKVDDDTTASVTLTIYQADELTNLLNYLVQNTVGRVDYNDIVYIGSDDGSADYLHKIYSSVSYYRFNGLESITRKMLAADAPNNSKTDMTSIEWIVVHDTAGSAASSTASANAGWATNPTNTGTSWHYTVGNDGIFQQLEDNHVGYHAGDGTTVPFEFYKTDILATKYFPVVTISADGYYEIDGQKSNVKAPDVAGRTAKTEDINTNGIRAVVGEDGYYYLPKTRYSTKYAGQNIVMYGGNLNGIGIETAVNKGSDVWLTWQMTAKLAASLAIKHDLGMDRVVTHNHFDGKPCPRTMMTAGLYAEFMHMVEVEYTVQKNYADYTIQFVSHNPNLLDNTGRVIGVPQFDTTVSYTITVTSPENVSKSITLNTVIPGARYYQ